MPSKRQKSLQKTLATQVRRYRDEAGLTQEELADKCNLSRDMISRIERGTIACSLETVAKLAEVLLVPATSLFGGVSFTESPRSPRERALHQAVKLLITAETRDLGWITSVLEVIIRRPK